MPEGKSLPHTSVFHVRHPLKNARFLDRKKQLQGEFPSLHFRELQTSSSKTTYGYTLLKFFPYLSSFDKASMKSPCCLCFCSFDFLTWYAVHRWQVWGACWRGVIIRAGHSFDGIMIERCRAGHGKFGHPGHHNGEGILGEGWLWRHCVRTARGKISRESHRSRLADCGRRWTTFGKKKKKKRERISIFLLFTVFLKLNSFPLEISKTRNLFYCKILHD